MGRVNKNISIALHSIRESASKNPALPKAGSTSVGSRVGSRGMDLPAELERFWRTDDGLTARQRAAAYGIDLSLIDDNLRLTPAERLRQNDEALKLIDALRAGLHRARA